MRCYYHEDREAVGGCKSCGKGLCRECAVDFNKGLACRGHCEAEVQALIQLIDRNVQLSTTSEQLVKSSRSARSGSGIFQIVMGVIFLAWGFTDKRLWFTSVLGAAFFVYGIYWMILAQRLAKDKQK